MSSRAKPPGGMPDVFTYGEARRLGMSDRALRGLQGRGEVERLSRGLYRRTDAGADPDLLEIAARAPEATLCLATALAHHELTDEIPQLIDVALPRSRRQPEIAAPVRWHRFNPKTFDVGRDELVVGDLTIGIYSAERSICDAFRMRHVEGPEQATAALKRWLRRRGSQPSTLLSVAKALGPRAEAPIRGALEILL